jgi:hypothetical protein
MVVNLVGEQNQNENEPENVGNFWFIKTIF